MADNIAVACMKVGTHGGKRLHKPPHTPNIGWTSEVLAEKGYKIFPPGVGGWEKGEGGGRAKFGLGFIYIYIYIYI